MNETTTAPPLRALLLTTVNPEDPRQGDAWRVQGLLRGLLAVADTTVVQWGGMPGGGHRIVPDSMAAQAIRATRSILSGPPLSTLPYRTGFPLIPGRYDIVAGYPLKVARWALRVPAAIRVLDLTDSLGLLRERLSEFGYIGARLRLYGVGHEEIAWGRRFTEAWVASADDAEYLRERDLPTVVVPNGSAWHVDLPWVSPKQLLFVGNLRYPPNRRGLDEFLRLVWPPLGRIGFHLDVVGRGSDHLRGGRGVRGHGLVDDLEPFYRRAGVVVSPIRVGAGAPTKVLEALAAGRPVVAWSEGLGGLTPAQREGVLAVDGAPDWILALQRLQDRAVWDALHTAGLGAVDRWGEAQRARLEILLTRHFSTRDDGTGRVSVDDPEPETVG